MVNKQLIKLREFKSMIKTQTMSKDITFAFKKIFFEELSQGVYESFDAEDTSHSNYFIGIQHTLMRIMPNLIVDVETAKVYGNIIKLLNWQSATEFHFTFEDRSLLKKLQGSSKQEWTHSSIPHILRSTHFHYFYKHLINKLKFSDVKILYQQFQQEVSSLDFQLLILEQIQNEKLPLLNQLMFENVRNYLKFYNVDQITGFDIEPSGSNILNDVLNGHSNLDIDLSQLKEIRLMLISQTDIIKEELFWIQDLFSSIWKQLKTFHDKFNELTLVMDDSKSASILFALKKTYQKTQISVSNNDTMINTSAYQAYLSDIEDLMQNFPLEKLHPEANQFASYILMFRMIIDKLLFIEKIFKRKLITENLPTELSPEHDILNMIDDAIYKFENAKLREFNDRYEIFKQSGNNPKKEEEILLREFLEIGIQTLLEEIDIQLDINALIEKVKRTKHAIPPLVAGLKNFRIVLKLNSKLNQDYSNAVFGQAKAIEILLKVILVDALKTKSLVEKKSNYIYNSQNFDVNNQPRDGNKNIIYIQENDTFSVLDKAIGALRRQYLYILNHRPEVIDVLMKDKSQLEWFTSFMASDNDDSFNYWINQNRNSITHTYIISTLKEAKTFHEETARVLCIILSVLEV